MDCIDLWYDTKKRRKWLVSDIPLGLIPFTDTPQRRKYFRYKSTVQVLGPSISFSPFLSTMTYSSHTRYPRAYTTLVLVVHFCFLPPPPFSPFPVCMHPLGVSPGGVSRLKQTFRRA